MEEKETIEGNKLIAEFMGLLSGKSAYPFTKPGDTVNYRDALYHTSWDWLMPVVFKIKGYTVPEQKTAKKQFKLEDEAIEYWNSVLQHLCTINIFLLWHSVIEFIKWYNQQQEQESKLTSLHGTTQK